MKGPGHIQRAVIAAFRANLDRRVTAMELACAAFDTNQPSNNQLRAVRRAADLLAENLGYQRRRIMGRVTYALPTTAMRLQSEALAKLREIPA